MEGAPIMDWYYSELGAQVGPMDDETFELAVLEGKVTPDTLVWREGLENWVRYGDVPDAGDAVAAPADDEAPLMRACIECGRTFPEDDMMAFRNAWVCGDCTTSFPTEP